MSERSRQGQGGGPKPKPLVDRFWPKVRKTTARLAYRLAGFWGVP